MKTFTRVIAVVMMVAVLASLMVACGGAKKEENHPDNNIVGTWKQTDDKYGNWTWTFNNDGTCKLESDTDNFSSEGTYIIGEKDIAKIKIKLDKWDKERMYTYAVTPKVLDLESFDESYYCKKQ